MTESSHPIVLYDGLCNVCDASVRFILDHDPDGLFHFASLQSTVGQALASDAGVDVSDLGTVVLVVGGRGLVRSDAILEIAKRLGLPWSLASVLRIVPRPVRDIAYRFVAANRTRWFGQRSECQIPSPELRTRFHDL